MSFKNYLKNQNVLVFKNVSFIVSYRVVFMIFFTWDLCFSVVVLDGGRSHRKSTCFRRHLGTVQNIVKTEYISLYRCLHAIGI